MDIKKITDFCKAAAPWKAMDVLPTSDFPQEMSNTNTDFLSRLISDSSDKLRSSDPPAQHINFTSDDISNLSAGCCVMIQLIVGDLTSLSPRNERVLKNTLISAERLTAYYADELATIADERENITRTGTRLYEEFKRACHARDYATLARMYPHRDRLLGLKRKPDTQNLNRGIPSIPQKLYEREKTEAIKHHLKDAGPLIPGVVSYKMMGYPHKMEDFEFTMAHLNRSRARNSAVHESLRVFLPGFEDALSDAPAPAVLPLLKRQPLPGS